jgi:uncharacterized membrane protein YbhN (UPF0104 family)
VLENTIGETPQRRMAATREIAPGVFAIAWVIGFVTLVSPGGIGVREAVLLAGLTPAYGAGTALGVAILYRLVTSLGDGLGFLIGFIAEKRLDRMCDV